MIPDLDLTEAIAVYHRAHCAARKGKPLVRGEYEATYSRIEVEWITEALTAAAPIIARQASEKIAKRIEAARTQCHESAVGGFAGESAGCPADDCMALTHAARIAREVAR